MLTVSGPHWVCPHSRRVLSWSTLLRLQVALQGNCLKQALGCVHFPGLSCSGSGSPVLHKGIDSVGPVFCAVSRSEQLRRPSAWWAHSPQVCGASYHLSGPSLSVSWLRSSALSQVCSVSPLGSWSLAATLLADVNCPRSQEGSVNNWERVRSLVGDAFSGAEFAPFWLWLPPACLPASGGGLSGLLLASSPLVFAQSFVLWVGQQYLRLGLFSGKFSLSLLFSLSGYPTVWVAISC